MRSPRGSPRAGVGVRRRRLDSRSVMSWPAQRSGSDRTRRRRGSGDWTICFTAIALQLGSRARAALSNSAAICRRHVVGPAVGAQHCRMVANPERRGERANAILVHVAEGHWVIDRARQNAALHL
jgi:hypothetical protein